MRAFLSPVEPQALSSSLLAEQGHSENDLDTTLEFEPDSEETQVSFALALTVKPEFMCASCAGAQYSKRRCRLESGRCN